MEVDLKIPGYGGVRRMVFWPAHLDCKTSNNVDRALRLG